MATQVFISWSGELSKKLADAIREWLPATLQFVRPYFTPLDIEKGTRWVSEISTELSKSQVGIICLTRDNLNSPWILFEAGALSKNLEQSRVCTLLFGLGPTDVTGPLTLFQHTRFLKDDFKKLVQTINNAGADSKLLDSVLDEVFEMWWPKLEEQIAKILTECKGIPEGSQRTEREILEEILELTRMNTRYRVADIDIRQSVLDAVSDVLPALDEKRGTRPKRWSDLVGGAISSDEAFRTEYLDYVRTHPPAADQ